MWPVPRGPSAFAADQPRSAGGESDLFRRRSAAIRRLSHDFRGLPPTAKLPCRSAANYTKS